jgi:hypothetical protein
MAVPCGCLIGLTPNRPPLNFTPIPPIRRRKLLNTPRRTSWPWIGLIGATCPGITVVLKAIVSREQAGQDRTHPASNTGNRCTCTRSHAALCIGRRRRRRRAGLAQFHSRDGCEGRVILAGVL